MQCVVVCCADFGSGDVLSAVVQSCDVWQALSLLCALSRFAAWPTALKKGTQRVGKPFDMCKLLHRARALAVQIGSNWSEQDMENTPSEHVRAPKCSLKFVTRIGRWQTQGTICANLAHCNWMLVIFAVIGRNSELPLCKFRIRALLCVCRPFEEDRWRGYGALISQPPHTTAERTKAALKAREVVRVKEVPN